MMTSTIYVNNEHFIAGTTLKNADLPEQFNMGLHVAQNPDAVIENRQALAASLNCTIDQLVCANQTHSANFHKVTKADLGKGATSQQDAIANTDALYTFERGAILTSFSADCVPVILYSEEEQLAGVVHSGWQGTVKEITYKLLQHLQNNEHCDLTKVHVVIGTALSKQKFEVDRDVYDQFKALGYADDFMYFNDETNKYHIDNQLTVKQQCIRAGVLEQNITIDQNCTFIREDGFSYRQQRDAGRHCTFILKK